MEKSGNAQGGETDIEERMARIEEAYKRIAWRQQLYDLEGVMPQLLISLPADIIAKLNKIAENNNKELIDNGKEPTIRASTVAARIVKMWFERGENK